MHVMHTHTHMHVMHTHTYTHMTEMHTHTHTHTHTCETHTHIHTHACDAHTHTHTHTHTPSQDFKDTEVEFRWITFIFWTTGEQAQQIYRQGRRTGRLG